MKKHVYVSAAVIAFFLAGPAWAAGLSGSVAGAAALARTQPQALPVQLVEPGADDGIGIINAPEDGIGIINAPSEGPPPSLPENAQGSPPETPPQDSQGAQNSPPPTPPSQDPPMSAQNTPPPPASHLPSGITTRRSPPPAAQPPAAQQPAATHRRHHHRHHWRPGASQNRSSTPG